MATTPIPALTESYTPAGAASAPSLTNPTALSGVSPEAVAALEPLKVPDTTKSMTRRCSHCTCPELELILFDLYSRYSIRASRQCTRFEEQVLQNNCEQQVSICHSVSKEGTRLEASG